MAARVEYSHLSYLDFSCGSTILLPNFHCDKRVIKVRIYQELEKVEMDCPLTVPNVVAEKKWCLKCLVLDVINTFTKCYGIESF